MEYILLALGIYCLFLLFWIINLYGQINVYRINLAHSKVIDVYKYAIEQEKIKEAA
jgi:hypothetical protein